MPPGSDSATGAVLPGTHPTATFQDESCCGLRRLRRRTGALVPLSPEGRLRSLTSVGMPTVQSQ